MESNCKNRTLQWIAKQLDNGSISLTHKLQRKEGQWSTKAKSDLIDSLLREYPINPTCSIKEGNSIAIIDGVQRISTVRDYLSDKFPISKLAEPVIIKVKDENGERVEKEVAIAGKKFSKLDPEVKDLLLAAELQIYELAGCTEKDVREIFRRWNAGKSLNNAQLRTAIESDEMSDIIYSLTSHPFFKKVLTDTQRKKDLDKDLVVETIMLMETDADHDYTLFKNKNINDFVVMYQENIDNEKIEMLREGMDKLDESFEEIKINAVSIPMILYSSFRVVKDKKQFSRFVTSVQDFMANYDSNEGYKKFCQSGTSSSENVRGRLDYWRNVVRKL